MSELTIVEQKSSELGLIPFSSHVIVRAKNRRTETTGIHILIGDAFNLRKYLEGENIDIVNKPLRFERSIFRDDVLVEEVMQYHEVENLVYEGLDEDDDTNDEYAYNTDALKVAFPVLVLRR